MLQKLKANPIAWFLAKAFGLFLLWYLLYEFLLGKMIDLPVINNLIFLTKIVLKALGFTPIEGNIDNMRTVGIDGTWGVWVGDSCNGITILAIFSIVIICYPGPVKKKLWFIPLGIMLIHLLNVVRIAALSIILYYSPQSLAFNHTYTFTLIIYGFIFLLWMIWINKTGKTFSAKKQP